jgi:hypothetical protein
MLQMIDEGKALETTVKYFDILKNAGYVKPGMMQRYFLYMFLLDFVDYTHGFFTVEDYNAVDNALRKLFAGGGCLLPYSVFCVDKVTLGRNEYMGNLKNRITEDDAVDKDGKDIGNDDRITQDEFIRVV